MLNQKLQQHSERYDPFHVHVRVTSPVADGSKQPFAPHVGKAERQSPNRQNFSKWLIVKQVLRVPVRAANAKAKPFVVATLFPIENKQQASQASLDCSYHGEASA